MYQSYNCPVISAIIFYFKTVLKSAFGRVYAIKRLGSIPAFNLNFFNMVVSASNQNFSEETPTKGPILVLNSQANNLNLQPIVNLINDGYCGDCAMLAESIDKAIRFISLNSKNTEDKSYVNTLSLLYEIKDAFSPIKP